MRRNWLMALLLASVLGAVLLVPTSFRSRPHGVEAATFHEIRKLLASDVQFGPFEGFSVAVDGDTAVVGAHAEEFDGVDEKVYVFQRHQGGTNNWGVVQELIASDGQDTSLFGWSVAVSGDIAVVGDQYEGGVGAQWFGAAYVFQRNEGGTNNWGEVKKLTASDAENEDSFGYSVAISGDVLVVGANGESAAGKASGAAYVFERDEGGAGNWGEVKKLTASDASVSDYFGTSVAVSGDIVTAGAWLAGAGGSAPGAAYVFQRSAGGANNWGEVRKLTASDAQASDFFGYSVAVSEDFAVVGALYANAFEGAAYVFHRNSGGNDNWVEMKKLTASDAQAGASFGYSVAISGDVLVVGASGESAGGSFAGAAYVFQRDQGSPYNWGEVKKLTASDAQSRDFFGYSAAVSGDIALVGTYNGEFTGAKPPAAYVFDLAQEKTEPPPTPTPTPTPTATPTATPAPPAPPGPAVVLIHGYDFNQDAYTCGMDSLRDYLVQPANTGGENFRVYCMLYRTREGVASGASDLRNLINIINANEVDIVAHSMGGLVARYYIERLDGGEHRGKVRSLTMLGTPNLGTATAIPPCAFFSQPIFVLLGKYDQGACDLVPLSPLLVYLNILPGSHAGVDYRVLVGTVGNWVLYRPNDCTVSMFSSLGMLHPFSVYNDASHVTMSGIAATASGCTATGLVEHAGVSNEVAGILLASNGLAGSPAANGDAAGAPPPDEPAMSTLLLTSGVIEQGETIDVPVTFPGGEPSASFVFRTVSSSAVELVYTLLRPGGTPVVDSDSDAELLVGSAYANIDQTNYALTSPSSGEWTLRIDGTTVPVGGWPYETEVFIDGRIAVTVGTDAGRYGIDFDVDVTSFVTIDEVPTTANVSATVTKPDGTTAVLELSDDGSSGYEATYGDTLQCGIYQVVVTADGIDGGTPFTRQARTLFFVAVDGNAILDPCVADSDGDGLTDDVELSLYSTNPGRADTDGDLCSDGVELGGDETVGGLRDPLNPWDFYDVLGPGAALPTDGVIDLPNDILGVILHFSPQGQAPYDVRFDRGPSSGPNPWNMTAPDGVIDLPNDILGVILQFGHRCV